jgi:low affinity Fe/Cu permease
VTAQAIHAKLDELLRIHGDANNELMRVDEENAEEIEEERRHLRRIK